MGEFRGTLSGDFGGFSCVLPEQVILGYPCGGDSLCVSPSRWDACAVWEMLLGNFGGCSWGVSGVFPCVARCVGGRGCCRRGADPCRVSPGRWGGAERGAPNAAAAIACAQQPPHGPAAHQPQQEEAQHGPRGRGAGLWKRPRLQNEPHVQPASVSASRLSLHGVESCVLKSCPGSNFALVFFPLFQLVWEIRTRAVAIRWLFVFSFVFVQREVTGISSA